MCEHTDFYGSVAEKADPKEAINIKSNTNAIYRVLYQISEDRFMVYIPNDPEPSAFVSFLE